MRTYIVGIVLNSYKKSELVKLLDDGLSCFVSVHALILTAVFVDGGVVI